MVVSDSPLNLPGAIYGLQCRARQNRVREIRLLWVAVLPGAGAAELAEAWGRAPHCQFGLTIVNLNDCCKDGAIVFTDVDKERLELLVAKAKAHCAIRSDVFINHASFYPKLRPCYAELVPRYTHAAQQAGARVHDGAAWVKDTLLHDHMHFAPESTPLL